MKTTLARQAVMVLALAAGLSACQEAKEPTTTLTNAQWEEVRAQILTEPPASVAFASTANFGNKIEFLGVDIEPKSPKPGQEVTLTWYWKALADMEVNWQIFVHLDHKGPPPARQGMDHHPVRDLYQTTRWKPGQIIKDVQKVRLRGNYPGGEAALWVGLWDPATSRRLELINKDKITHDGSNRIKAATIKVDGPKGGAKAKKAKPKFYNARPVSTPPTIDGKLDEEAWSKKAAAANLGGTRGDKGPAERTWVKALYDAENLYLAFFAQDNDAWSSLKDRDSETWTEEVVEIFIDPDGDGKDYIELQVTPNNVIFDARFAAKLGRGKGSRQEQIDTAKAWTSKLVSAVHVDGTANDPSDTDKSWTVELKIPFADIPGDAPTAGKSWKINFYRFDAPREADGKRQRQKAWAWAPPFGSFHNVERFGTMRFVAAGAPIDPRPPRKAPVAPEIKPATPDKVEGVQPDKPE